MLYLLITVIIQSGTTDIFFDEVKTEKECLEQKKEKLLHDNEITKVRAYCVKQVGVEK